MDIKLCNLNKVWDFSNMNSNYNELLDRVYSMLGENDPTRLGDARTRIARRHLLPKLRVRAKKTTITNFSELCKKMNRVKEDDKRHIVQFIKDELNLKKDTSINGSEGLVIPGTFGQKKLEDLINLYHKNYV